MAGHSTWTPCTWTSYVLFCKVYGSSTVPNGFLLNATAGYFLLCEAFDGSAAAGHILWRKVIYCHVSRELGER